jgi:hypothetical protein
MCNSRYFPDFRPIRWARSTRTGRPEAGHAVISGAGSGAARGGRLAAIGSARWPGRLPASLPGNEFELCRRVAGTKAGQRRTEQATPSQAAARESRMR